MGAAGGSEAAEARGAAAGQRRAPGSRPAPAPRRVTAPGLIRMKAEGERITMLTAYDYRSARLFDAAGVDVLFVGDSLGMVVLGYDSTIPVTIEDMVHHTRPVARAARRALVLADLPFMSYTVSREQALINATRLVQEGGAQAVKLEGGRAVAPVVAALADCGIPVVGHLGLTPQSIHRFGGHRVQGRDQATAQRLVGDAHVLEDAGASAVVLELVPSALAARITAALKIPTIGIGAGPDCDGQVQVMHDLLGYATPDERIPRHAKTYATLGATIADAVGRYVAEVREGTFPGEEHGFTMEESVLAALEESPDA
jgi:3-methyl-2-oxobutanoate hydroxymethyltransferase